MASMRLVFVGTGVSCAVPVVGHVDLEKQLSSTESAPCCCTDAVLHPDGPNRRNNASLLISLLPTSTAAESSSRSAHILIDAGKTFRDAYFRVLAPLQVPAVDVLLVTHGHADAMHCVEEVCGWQTEHVRQARVSAISAVTREWLPTFLSRKALKEVDSISPELIARSKWVSVVEPTESVTEPRTTNSTNNNNDDDSEHVSTSLAMHELSENAVVRVRLDPYLPPLARAAESSTPLAVTVHCPASVTSTLDINRSNSDSEAASCGGEKPDLFPFFSVPVEHGKGYISMGFVFGHGTAFRSLGATRASVADQTCVVYISDVSDIPDFSMRFLEDLVKIDVLVFDLLAEKGSHSPSHTCWDDIMPFIRRLTPRKTYFVGMFCSLEHHASNAEWARDLENEKAKIRAELADSQKQKSHDTAEGCGAPQAHNVVRLEAFLDTVESLELAYDGQQLVLPL